VLDLAARRGTWLTTTRPSNNVAAGGLGALSYEPGTNTTTVAVLAEP